MSTQMRGSIDDRIKAKLQPSGACLIWTGTKRGEYGKIGWRGSYHATHRLVWTLANGPIPDGLLILHRCDVPLCCNIDHLFLGTYSDNLNDMWQKGRGGQRKPIENFVSPARAQAKSRKEYARIARREQVEAARKDGRCVVCCKRQKREDAVLCLHCTQQRAIYHKNKVERMKSLENGSLLSR